MLTSAVCAYKKTVLIAAFLLLGACASAPTQEMSDARQAVRAAHEAGADQHAPESLKKAEKQLDSAGAELDRRDFREARRDAVAAKVAAISAQDMAHAIGSAVAIVDRARQHGVLSDETDEILTRAHLAASEGNVLMAVRLANEAKDLAEQELRLK